MGRMFKALIIVPILVIRIPAHAEGIEFQECKSSECISYQQPVTTKTDTLSDLYSIPSFRAVDLRQPHQSLESLYDVAPSAQQELEDLANQIADHVDGTVYSAGIKGEARAKQKVEGELGGDASQLTDIVRVTVEVDSVDALTAAYAELATSTQTKEVINRFHTPRPSGYRDLKVLVALPETHMVAEVQLHLKKIADIKNGQEHEIYREIQKIERTAALEKRELSEHEFAKINRLRQSSRALYDQAWQTYQPLSVAV